MKKIVIGNDHTALEMKRELIEYLEAKGYEIVNVGTDEPTSFNYPIAGYKAAKMVAAGEVDGGIIICGTGLGISLAANKVHGIRCCVCSEPYTAKMSREHNNSNMLAFGARVIGVELAKLIVDTWLESEFQGGRHQNRVDMIMEIESTQDLQAAH